MINYFPTDLLNETDTVIGQPDAGDWGGLYVEYNFNGVRKFWLLDQMKSNVPTKYHNFIDKVNEKIGKLHYNDTTSANKIMATGVPATKPKI